MILLLAVAIGLGSGLLRARIFNRNYQVLELQNAWLVFLAVIPQLFAFQIPITANLIPDSVIPILLVSSQLVLLFFVWANQSIPGIWILGLGLGLNLFVISLNGGWMPISPTLVQELVPDDLHTYWEIGERLGMTKDLVLLKSETKLWALSDRFLLPAWFPWQVAFSLGDIFISLGIFWLLWAQAGPRNTGAAYKKKGG
jgi:hypothetical protein